MWNNVVILVSTESLRTPNYCLKETNSYLHLIPLYQSRSKLM